MKNSTSEKYFTKYFILLLIPVVFAVVLFLSFGLYMASNMRTRFIPFMPHQYFRLLFYPNYEGIIYKNNQVINIKFNSKGFRTKEFQLSPPPEKTRILCFGGSSTANLRSNIPWTDQLEKELSNQGYNVEVLNLGIPSYDIKAINILFSLVGQYLYPDIIIVYEGYNSFFLYERPDYSPAESYLKSFGNIEQYHKYDYLSSNPFIRSS